MLGLVAAMLHDTSDDGFFVRDGVGCRALESVQNLTAATPLRSCLASHTSPEPAAAGFGGRAPHFEVGERLTGFGTAVQARLPVGLPRV